METFQTLGAFVAFAVLFLDVMLILAGVYQRWLGFEQQQKTPQEQNHERLTGEWNAIITRKHGRTGGGSSE